MRYGYARVSSNSQNLARQIKILKDYGVDTLIQEQSSGANNHRPALTRLLAQIQEGDELVVSSLERLSRDPDFLTQTMLQLAMTGASLHSLDIPTFDEVANRNVQRLLKNLVVELKKFTAADELECINERQRQGIALAKKRGVYRGRVAKYRPDAPDPKHRAIYRQVVAMLADGQSIAAITHKLAISNSVVYRIRDHENF